MGDIPEGDVAMEDVLEADVADNVREIAEEAVAGNAAKAEEAVVVRGKTPLAIVARKLADAARIVVIAVRKNANVGTESVIAGRGRIIIRR